MLRTAALEDPTLSWRALHLDAHTVQMLSPHSSFATPLHAADVSQFQLLHGAQHSPRYGLAATSLSQWTVVFVACNVPVRVCTELWTHAHASQVGRWAAAAPSQGRRSAGATGGRLLLTIRRSWVLGRLDNLLACTATEGMLLLKALLKSLLFGLARLPHLQNDSRLPSTIRTEQVCLPN